jgi:hypothetical protein
MKTNIHTHTHNCDDEDYSGEREKNIPVYVGFSRSIEDA